MQTELETDDKLPSLITKLALCPQEDWRKATAGKHDSIETTNLALLQLHQKIDSEKWLEEMSTYLYCKTEKLKLSASQKPASDFAYIPIPGTKNGSRIKHPCENPGTPIEKILTLAPSLRSRELAWLIPYKTAGGLQNLIIVFTFDPLNSLNMRSNAKSWEECNKYWRDALRQSELLPAGENANCLHVFTNLAEWMRVLLANDSDTSPKTWVRHTCPISETEAAARVGLDIYYSSGALAYAWSSLEKQKGRDRAQKQLQQDISKRVSLFDPIYGRWAGNLLETEKKVVTSYSSGESEEEKNAKSFWENTIITAQETGASDIHIEPIQQIGKTNCDLIISLRQDGQLNFYTRIPSNLAVDFTRFALETSGILREDNKRPQDGRRSWRNPRTNACIDLRISATPVGTSTQKIVMRLLDTSKLKRGITDLGLEQEETEIWLNALKLNQSMVLVSGPTNSGKSTTLYAALLTIYQRDNRRSFATIEDPVEYRLPFRATQAPVNEDKGVTYEKLIRQAMRNDGDTFLIGEIRDRVTANAAIQLSLTGHQVLSSIHANSASETALRLLELGTEPNLVGESVKLIVAQKLIPNCCPHCQQPIPEKEIGQALRQNSGEILLETYNAVWEKKYRKKAKWVESLGCYRCRFTGLLGMSAAQEFLIIDKDNKKFLREGNVSKISESMKEKGLLTMEQSVWKLAWQGIIPVTQAGEVTNQLRTG